MIIANALCAQTSDATGAPRQGYRYELWCIARSCGTRYCMLHCATDAATAAGWNAARAEAGEPAYRPEMYAPAPASPSSLRACRTLPLASTALPLPSRHRPPTAVSKGVTITYAGGYR